MLLYNDRPNCEYFRKIYTIFDLFLKSLTLLGKLEISLRFTMVPLTNFSYQECKR